MLLSISPTVKLNSPKNKMLLLKPRLNKLKEISKLKKKKDLLKCKPKKLEMNNNTTISNNLKTRKKKSWKNLLKPSQMKSLNLTPKKIKSEEK